MLPPEEEADEAGLGNRLDLPPQAADGRTVDPRQDTAVAKLFLHRSGPEAASQNNSLVLHLSQGNVHVGGQEPQGLGQIFYGERTH